MGAVKPQAFRVPRGVERRMPQPEPLGGLLVWLLALHDNPVSVLVTHHELHSFAPVLSDHQVYLPHDAVVPGLLSSMDLPGLRSVVERPGLAGFEMGRPINYFGQLMKDSPNHTAFWLAFRLKE